MSLSQEECRDLAEHFATQADDAYAADSGMYKATLAVAYALMAKDPARGYPSLSEFFDGENLPVTEQPQGWPPFSGGL